MTRRTHVALAAAIAATLTLGLGACSSTGSGSSADEKSLTTAGDGIIGGTPVKGGTLHVLADQDFSDLDPTRNWVEPEMDFGIRTLYRTLTTFKAEPGAGGEQIVPDMATDLGEPSDGDKTWTFHLKDGLKYEDGSPIVAQDIKYNVERSFSPDLPGGPEYAKTYLDAPADYQGPLKGQDLPSTAIDTPDAKTIVFHLKRPVAEFGYTVTLPTFAPVPKAKEAGADYANHPFSSGPYKIQSYDRGKQLVLVRNTYWDQSTDPVRKAYPDKIVVDQTLSPTNVADRLIANQGDDQSAIAYADLDPSKVSSVITDPSVKARLVSENSNCDALLDMDTSKAPFNNQNLRLAVEYAIDKGAYQAAVGGPALADIATTLLPPEITGGTSVDHFKIPVGGDLDKAKQYLAAGGAPNGFSTTLTVASSEEQRAESLQASLKRVGINVTINAVDASVAYSVEGNKNTQTGLSVGGWCPDYPSASTFLPMMFDSRIITDTGNQGNVSRFNDPAVDAEMDRIAGLTDVTAANQAWQALDAKIMDEAPAVPLTWQKKPLLVGSNIAGAFAAPVWSAQIDYATVGLKSLK
ncbi:ABC transporter substrate-binding protein [Kitasatospora sp. NBC_01287]|uniref:ABC transporter substrate-binding protein n=1 Tax=Kitasatospora sp. NBC_01287 TaxID=2903573 RepID=UPI00225A6DE1|nr:ABC transporter substrate-binding protein [Kitasatospora sp. NBC_01287]MCX4750190.1 ABC transporter substrate-binding protein [Kitasatospora sp. NBC_01287]